jgi:hypothetical protein
VARSAKNTPQTECLLSEGGRHKVSQLRPNPKKLHFMDIFSVTNLLEGDKKFSLDSPIIAVIMIMFFMLMYFVLALVFSKN